MPVCYVAEGINKTYGQNQVLKRVNLTLKTGEIHALVGHNGAGKSTLLRILSGVEKPDQGLIKLGNKLVSFDSPRDAQSAGVSCVYQELRLVNELTVAENMFLGQEIKRKGVLLRKDMNRVTKELLENYGLSISPTEKVRTLTHPQRQLVEIISALHKNAQFLLLDEPTTSLEYQQIEALLSTLENIVKTKEIGVVLVTHKLDEVYAVSDKISVLCDGDVVVSGSVSEITQEDVIRYIIGKEINDTSSSRKVNHRITPVMPSEKPSLVVNHIRTSKVEDISLKAYPGQVLGIYGLGGSGRTEFLRALYGLDSVLSGSISLNGVPYQPKNPAFAIRKGIAYVTEERKSDGFIPFMNGIMNAGLPVVSQFSKFGFIKKKKLTSSVSGKLEPLHIRGNIMEPMQRLSGGNQQKVLFARAILQKARILLLDEPTKGIDIGAKSEIYNLIRSLIVENSTTVIVVSSEEEEILAISDQIVIFRSGICDGHLYTNEEMSTSKLRNLALEEGVKQ